MSRPTHFQYQPDLDSEGGPPGHYPIPQRLAVLDARTLAEHGPNELFHNWYVVGRELPSHRFYVSVRSRIPGFEAPADAAVELDGKTTDVKKLRTIAHWLRRLTREVG